VFLRRRWGRVSSNSQGPMAAEISAKTEIPSNGLVFGQSKGDQHSLRRGNVTKIW
jgi:hypothetical protein